MRLFLPLAAAALLVPCLALHADTLDYKFVGSPCPPAYTDCTSPTAVLEFQLPSQPTPTAYDDTSFRVRDYTLIQNNFFALLPPSAEFPFSYNGVSFISGNDGFAIYNYPSSDLLFTTRFGPVFSGPTSAPTLLTGSSDSAILGYGSLGFQGTLTVTDITTTTPVPEPSSLALLGTGLLGFVAAARRHLS